MAHSAFAALPARIHQRLQAVGVAPRQVTRGRRVEFLEELAQQLTHCTAVGGALQGKVLSPLPESESDHQRARSLVIAL